MTYLFKTVTLVTAFLTACAVSDEENLLEIKTESGYIRGQTVSTTEGKDVDVFWGIPYAASASGKNRFAAAKEVEHWDGVLNATKLPNPCYNIISPMERNLGLNSKRKEMEDCLKLNIWLPKPRPEKSAVMVWIHGGGFASGSSDLDIYNGGNLAAEEKIIVVSMNYRLSGFGFLYLDHPLAPGNVGLMDQALSLKWVRENIQAFGGDPEKLTIFGESAGGASVGLHLLAPSSQDLFRNAILQSSSGADLWAKNSPQEALKQSLKLAKNLGCPTNLEKRDEIVQCLQDVNAEKLANSMIEMLEPGKSLFMPIVDGHFLPDYPDKMISEGMFLTGKKILIGYNKEDGAAFLPILAPHMELKEDTVFTEEEIKQFISKALSIYQEDGIDGFKLDMVKHIYTDWESYPQDRISARTQLLHYFTDQFFACGAFQIANTMSENGNNVFFYRFDHPPEKHYLPFKFPSWVGSLHGDELPFIFGQLLENKNEEAKLSKEMMRYWANFAKHSDPYDEYLPRWPKYNSQEKLMILFHGKGLTFGKNDRVKACAFWENIFPNIKNEFKNEL